MIRLAFDIGGTFTDFVLHDTHADRLLTAKLPSTPADPADAVLNGLEALLRRAGIEAGAVDQLLHATTVATNAVIERKGAPTGLIATEGFRDVLIIGRQKRYETYDLYIDKPAPLVRRRDIAEVRERIGHDGAVVVPPDPASIDRAIDAMLASRRDSVAVALIHAYANPAHERAVRDRIRARAPDLSVSLSSEVSPRFREYERTSTTVANAYVKPVVDRYIARLDGALKQRGLRRDLYVMQSNGGLVSPGLARRYPIRIVESGPAAGVLMSAMVAAGAGHRHAITLDMGGTTAKLGAVDDGRPAITPSFEIGHVRYKKGSGLPINAPAVDLLEIGAGGGSIARAESGMIMVGPESAGADPGPACYGRGGVRATVTDANLVLGYLDPDYFNAGAMALDPAAAKAAIGRDVAAPLQLSPGEAAWAVHLVATSNMEHAMRLVSVERGRDPRRHVLVAFGGAGPLHAARLARAVGVPTVIVPGGAGVGSALGLLAADTRIDVSTTRVMRLDGNAADAIRAIYAGLEQRARADLRGLGVDGGTVRWARYAYMRHAGQGFEIHVDLPDGSIAEDYGRRAAEAFRRAYAGKHRFRDEQAAVEAVDWALTATAPSGGGRTIGGRPGAEGPPPGARRAWFPEAGGYTETRITNRAALAAGDPVAGPAIIADPDSTTVVPPGDTARLGADDHLIIEIAADGGGSTGGGTT